jgi:integrase
MHIFIEIIYMQEATFVLKEPLSKEPTLIYLFFRFNKQRLKYSTSEKIAPKFWNSETQRARETRTFSDAAALNIKLDDLASAVKNGYRDLVNEKKLPTISKLKEILDQSQFKKEFAQKTSFLKFVDQLILNSNRKRNTLKQWRQTYKKLLEFKRYSNTEIDFDNIDLQFYDTFLKFLIGKGYAKNTIGGFIKAIKIFMNEAVDRNLTKNFEYRNKKFKVMEEQVDKIYLSQNELANIYKLDLGDDQRLEKVRDLFIIACYTGLRFSDLTQIRKENIINVGKHIKIRTEKTSELVVIPLQKFVLEIIAKYKGNLPPVISNQKMNNYLKEIGEIAGIDETVKIAITKGGKTENNLFPKFDLMTTHTARRSFSTNAYLMDIPSISIMKITGHRTERSFMKYIRISQEDNANKLANHPFFN